MCINHPYIAHVVNEMISVDKLKKSLTFIYWLDKVGGKQYAL